MIGQAAEFNYTVLLCVDFDEAVIRRYNELLKRCEIQGGTTQRFGSLYITRRNLRITKTRTIQYNLILALGGEDAADIAQRIYNEKGQIAVAFFDLHPSKSDVLEVISSIKGIFSNLICAVALHGEQDENRAQVADLFSSPSEWLYFLSESTPEQMEQLIAHLISSFVLHREKVMALAKNEATREALRQILDASPELLQNQTEAELSQAILKNLRMLTGATDTYLLQLDNKEEKLCYIAGTGEFSNEANFAIEHQKKESLYEAILSDTKIARLKEGILAPLWVQDKPVGLLFLDHEHLLTKGTELLDVFAHHVAFAIENRRLQKEIEQKQALEHELNLASRIQESLLPKSFPEIPGLEIYGLTKSAKEIGGDYFDILSYQDSHYFCIGDVSGKGVPAGLIMSELRSFVRAFSMICSSPKDILLQSTELILDDIGGSGKFVSMLLFQWDGESLVFSSAGHEHILHYHAQTGICDAYRSGGVVIGVDFRNFSRLLKEKEIEWEEGDIILLFTDGATEAKNTKNEMFKLETLQKLVEKYKDLSIKDMTHTILDEINKFIGEAEQHDDITLLGLKNHGYLDDEA